MKSVSSFISPVTKKEKEKRFKQFKDIFLFTSSVLLIIKFSKHIDTYLTVDTKEI